MELKELHQEVNQKLTSIEAEIQRFRTNIQSCDDHEQRTLLEQDLSTLETIRDKLIKARQVSQEVTDFRKRVENPPVAGARILGVPRWFFVVALGAALGLLAWWAATI